MKQYVVDAFTDHIFGGNPAAVCVLDTWPTDELMMSLADENHLSETAFAVKENGIYHLRWFTPGGEVNLCGHATLATAFVLLNFYETDLDHIVFSTMSGELVVWKKEDRYELDLPAFPLKSVPVTHAMEEAIGVCPEEAWLGRDLVCVLPTEEDVRNHTPDMEKTAALEGLLLHTTAVGSDYHCVSRSFGPKLKIPEDPVCGSGHCHIIPYWSKRLNRDEIAAYQASKRGGELYCRLEGDRVKISGKAVLFSEAQLFL